MSVEQKEPEYYAKIYQKVEQILGLYTDAIEYYLSNETIGDLTAYTSYQIFTASPEGNRALKKLQGFWHQKILHEEKKHRQEFRLHHLTRRDTRAKYGKKFLDSMKAMGMMSTKEYNELLPYTTHLPGEGQEDPLFDRLEKYWIVPVWEKNEKNDYPKASEYVKVGLPRSGAKVFEGFMSDLARSGHEVYQDVWLTMDVLEYMKVIQKDKGDIAALQYFRDSIYSKYLTDEEFRKCTGNNRKHMQKLKEDMRDPLQTFMWSLDRYLPSTPPEAEVKSIDVSRKMQNPHTSRGYTKKRNGTNVVAKSEQIYWV